MSVDEENLVCIDLGGPMINTWSDIPINNETINCEESFKDSPLVMGHSLENIVPYTSFGCGIE